MDLEDAETKSDVSVYPSHPPREALWKDIKRKKMQATGASGLTNGARGPKTPVAKRMK